MGAVQMLALLLLYLKVVAANDAADWCEYVRSTPEPALLFYNRIPKSGSTTLEHIISLQSESTGSFDAIASTRSFWGNYMKDEDMSNALYKFINSHKSELALRRAEADLPKAKTPAAGAIHLPTFRRRTVLDGHITYFNFTASSVHGSANDRIEYMQLIRDCVGRTTSQFYYALYDCIAAEAANRQGNLEQYQEGLLNTTNVTACKLDRACYTSSPLYKTCSTHAIFAYMAGDCVDCLSIEDRVASVKKRIVPGLGQYVTFGTLEHLEEYMEMLECVYPTYFAGAAAAFRAIPVHSKPSKVDEQRERVTEQFTKKCNGATDETLYPHLKQVFLDRYAHMKQHSCCRRKRKEVS